MLKAINATLLRTPLVEGAPTQAAHADPAGFSSLLRQQTVPAPAPAPAPAPMPAPSASATARAVAHEAPASHDAAAPKPSNASRSEAQAADTSEPAEATESRSPTARGPAPKAKLRNGDATTRGTAADNDAKAASDAADATTGAATATASPGTAANNPSTGATPPVIGDWLAALHQRQTAVESSSSTDHADDAAIDADASDNASRARLPADLGAADAAGTAHATRTIVEPADAAVPAFAAALAERQLAEPAAHSDATTTAPVGAAGLGAAPATGSARDVAAPVAVALPTPIDAPDFAQTLGVQLSVLAKDGVQQAELHLNPADMGPVSVQIVMDGTQARIDFGADVAATRHAIEAGLPELASALRDAGYTLAGGGVSQHAGSRQQHRNGTPQDEPRRALRAVGDDSVTRVGQAARRIVARGGVDLYA